MDSELIFEWYRFADTDLALAKHALSMYPQPLEAICYHCQQSAEKYLKGYLAYTGNAIPPKIHNLDTLCEMCEEHDERFQELRKPCSILTDYSVQPRYPHEMEILEHEMKQAIVYAEQIRDFMLLKNLRMELEQKINDINNGFLSENN